MRVGIVTLGCDKNTVDNEYLAGLLEEAGCELVHANGPDIEALLAHALDAATVLTCGFIGDAKQQSIEVLVALAESKRRGGNPARLYAAGCLAQRYAAELSSEIPELDGIVGVGQWADLARMLTAPTPAERMGVRAAPRVEVSQFHRRKPLEDAPYAFLKIADGCSHACAFCSIPLMKGPLRSVPPEILLEEARSLLRRGARELNVIAQDISVYGADRGGTYRLAHLLRDLAAIEGDFWIRCLYCYPAGVTDELIAAMAEEAKIVPYLDVPLQHLDGEILRRMNRPGFDLEAATLVERLRRGVPGIALRTTMLVGFPGETPRAHARMLEGIELLAFNWLGAFDFSAEEGTPAAALPRQVGARTRRRRLDAVMAAQAEITERLNRARVGTRTRALVERFDAERNAWIARTPMEAPEADGLVYIAGTQSLKPGDFVRVTITGADGYDLEACIAEA